MVGDQDFQAAKCFVPSNSRNDIKHNCKGRYSILWILQPILSIKMELHYLLTNFDSIAHGLIHYLFVVSFETDKPTTIQGCLNWLNTDKPTIHVSFFLWILCYSIEQFWIIARHVINTFFTLLYMSLIFDRKYKNAFTFLWRRFAKLKFVVMSFFHLPIVLTWSESKSFRSREIMND